MAFRALRDWAMLGRRDRSAGTLLGVRGPATCGIGRRAGTTVSGVNGAEHGGSVTGLLGVHWLLGVHRLDVGNPLWWPWVGLLAFRGELGPKWLDVEASGLH